MDTPFIYLLIELITCFLIKLKINIVFLKFIGIIKKKMQNQGGFYD